MTMTFEEWLNQYDAPKDGALRVVLRHAWNSGQLAMRERAEECVCGYQGSWLSDPANDALSNVAEKISQLEPENEMLRGDDEANAEWGCFVEVDQHGMEMYPTCVLDSGSKLLGCSIARELRAAGKCKTDCKYWRRASK